MKFSISITILMIPFLSGLFQIFSHVLLKNFLFFQMPNWFFFLPSCQTDYNSNLKKKFFHFLKPGKFLFHVLFNRSMVINCFLIYPFITKNYNMQRNLTYNVTCDRGLHRPSLTHRKKNSAWPDTKNKSLA